MISKMLGMAYSERCPSVFWKGGEQMDSIGLCLHTGCRYRSLRLSEEKSNIITLNGTNHDN